MLGRRRCGLAEAAGHGEPRVLARQFSLVLGGAITAMMVSGNGPVLDIADRNVRGILAARRP